MKKRIKFFIGRMVSTLKMVKFLITQTMFILVMTACLGPNQSNRPDTSTRAEPAGCLKPIDSYKRVVVNGQTLSERTLAMLAHAKELYGGEFDITDSAISQGSYSSAVSSSLDTHAGGGALDLSFTQDDMETVLQTDIESIIKSLRTAGFAAWLREKNELYEESAVHIHAIAVGDKELSASAEAQLTGEAGYFRGKSGLPPDVYGTPAPDRFGGPIICNWMLDLGYRDMR
jgi:hypothetical protein